MVTHETLRAKKDVLVTSHGINLKK